MSVHAGIILAGGQARRMGGGDKGLLTLGGRPILAHVMERLAPQVGHLAINANGDPARFGEFDLPVIADTVPGFPGPLAGLLAGMEWAKSLGATHVITAAADTPFPPADLVDRLTAAARAGGTPIAIAATEDPQKDVIRHPTFGLWPVALADDLKSALQAGTRKVVAWADPHGVTPALFPSAPYDPFFNVNTPQDLDCAKQILRLAI
jgi:molybdopterin-guanine dinucleotide biosynthesis protein A